MTEDRYANPPKAFQTPGWDKPELNMSESYNELLTLRARVAELEGENKAWFREKTRFREVLLQQEGVRISAQKVVDRYGADAGLFHIAIDELKQTLSAAGAPAYELPEFSPDYWQDVFGGSYAPQAGLGKASGSHPLTVKRVMADLGATEAADVIAALVWNLCWLRIREGRALKELANALAAESAPASRKDALNEIADLGQEYDVATKTLDKSQAKVDAESLTEDHFEQRVGLLFAMLKKGPALSKDDVRDILRDAESATPAPSPWRDIESAPKDGTKFLAWGKAPSWSEDWFVIETRWREYAKGSIAHSKAQAGEGPSGSFEGDRLVDGEPYTWFPTHWMPLPPAPAEGA
ncbi:MAG: hypothetical protein AAFU68_02935 [Pseudomonadota bacterium]